MRVTAAGCGLAPRQALVQLPPAGGRPARPFLAACTPGRRGPCHPPTAQAVPGGGEGDGTEAPSSSSGNSRNRRPLRDERRPAAPPSPAAQSTRLQQQLVMQAAAVRRDLADLVGAQRGYSGPQQQQQQQPAAYSPQQQRRSGQRTGFNKASSTSTGSSGTADKRQSTEPEQPLKLWYEPPAAKKGATRKGGSGAANVALDGGSGAAIAEQQQPKKEPASWQARDSGAPLPFISVAQGDMDASIAHTFGNPRRISHLPGGSGGTGLTSGGANSGSTSRLARWPPPIKTATNVLVVSAALMNQSNQVLLAKRTKGSAKFRGMYEFPGGKVEPGEIPQYALQRELHEEIGVEVEERALQALTFVSHRYGYWSHNFLALLFVAEQWRNEPRPMEGQELEWVHCSQLMSYADKVPLPTKRLLAAVYGVMLHRQRQQEAAAAAASSRPGPGTAMPRSRAWLSAAGSRRTSNSSGGSSSGDSSRASTAGSVEAADAQRGGRHTQQSAGGGSKVQQQVAAGGSRPAQAAASDSEQQRAAGAGRSMPRQAAAAGTKLPPPARGKAGVKVEDWWDTFESAQPDSQAPAPLPADSSADAPRSSRRASSRDGKPSEASTTAAAAADPAVAASSSVAAEPGVAAGKQRFGRQQQQQRQVIDKQPQRQPYRSPSSQRSRQAWLEQVARRQQAFLASKQQQQQQQQLHSDPAGQAPAGSEATSSFFGAGSASARPAPEPAPVQNAAAPPAAASAPPVGEGGAVEEAQLPPRRDWRAYRQRRANARLAAEASGQDRGGASVS